MYGIGLLLLLLTQAQVGANRDFGWMIDEDGSLVYIVQVSPLVAGQMQAMQKEATSDMPPQLVGRVTRIAVRIGTENLPRTPSLAEIERTIKPYGSVNDVTAAILGPGKISDVESGSVVNVQQPGRALFSDQPQLPLAPGGIATSGDPTQSADDNVVDRALASSLRDQFLNDASQGPQDPSGLPSRLPSTSGGDVSKYANTGVPTDSNRGYSDPTGNNMVTSRQGNLSGPDVTQNLPQSLPGSNGGMATYGQTNDPQYLPQPSVESPNGNFGGIGNSRPLQQRTPTPNFGSTPGAGAYSYDEQGRQFSDLGGRQNSQGNYMDPAYPNGVHEQRAQPGFGQESPGYGSGQFNTQNRNPTDGYGPRMPGVADTRSSLTGTGTPRTPQGLPGTDRQFDARFNEQEADNANRSNSGSLAGGQTQRTDSSSPSDAGAARGGSEGSTGGQGRSGAQQYTGSQQPGSVLVQMFFLVSLVANVYLVYLLRKLLTRYRSLLSTVRSHAV